MDLWPEQKVSFEKSLKFHPRGLKKKKEILENPTRSEETFINLPVEAEETDWRAMLNKTAALTHPRVCRSVSRQKGRLRLTPPHPLRITHPSPQAPRASPPLFLVRKCHNSNVLTLGGVKEGAVWHRYYRRQRVHRLRGRVAAEGDERGRGSSGERRRQMLE